MVPKKLACRRLLLGCFGADSKAEPMLPEPEHRASGHHRHSHSRPLVPRISLSDLSDPGDLSSSVIGSNLHCFTRSELKVITHGFSVTNMLGEGGFGPVYKGFVDNKLRPGLKPQPVAVKVLNLEGTQGHREWLAEVIFLGQLKHPNLVRLIGYCFEDEHRFLVYEYMVRGNLDNHLFRKYSATLPWSTRVKIALEAAKGLAFLHEGDKPVIYRDFKASNILLDSDYTAKLSDFGLAKDGPDGDDTHVTTRVVGTHGYAAPEYIKTGHLTMMSDVYSYGVVLLELLTGRRSLDKSRPRREKSLVDWAGPLLKDPRKLDRLMDPRLEGQYTVQGARKAAALAHRCLSHHRESRPTMSTVVKRLEALVETVDIVVGPFVYVVPGEAEKNENDGEEGSSNGEKGGGKGRDEVKQSVVGVRHRKGRHGHRHRRSRAIHSDPALYRY